MSKVLIIGDVHLSPRTPASRKDKYADTMISKLSSLSDLITKHNVEHLIFLGDLFNTKHMTLPYFIKCFTLFKDLHNTGVKLHLVIGNHDIYYNSESTMEESPIQILLDSDIFENSDFTIGKTSFHLFNYTIPVLNIPKVQNDQADSYNVLIGHYFYNLGFNDDEHTITKELAQSLGYNSYILGHDHTVYSPVETKHYVVHRPGSFSRGTSHTSQMSRDSIQVILFDADELTYDYLDVPNVLPSKDVYKELASVSKMSFYDMDMSLEKLLSSLDFNNSSDIFSTLSTIEMDSDVKELVYSYLQDEGMFNPGGDG